MKMTWRWYGEGNDSITLSHIKQIPGVEGVVWALHDLSAGEVWPLQRIQEVKEQADLFGFNIDVVESVNVHDDIKIGLPTRDKYIENYIQTIRNLASVGVKVICYNFMPVFDWTRTDLYHAVGDGSNALYFENDFVKNQSFESMIEKVLEGAGDMTMPGWEPERLARVQELFELYKNVDDEVLFDNLKYFLERVIPVCKEVGIKMAIHPDDPPFSIFGLPRIINNVENIRKFLALVDENENGLTLCTGSLGGSTANDIPSMIKEFGSRIHFAHIRNVKVFDNGDFIETSHRECDGSVPVIDVLKAYHELGFKGYIRPDHGRHLWGEEKECRPGYGLYDRALGVMYMLGVWDTLEKEN
jgi:mannonate dehydratase